MSATEGKFSAKDWDEVRMGFHTSIMVDTSLNSLAQNLDAPDWPLHGKEETPAKYIDLTFEDLQLVPGLAGRPDRIDHLITILRDTLAFDDPFGEMVDQSTAIGDRDNPLLKNLAKLEIPTSFPIEFTMVSPDTKEFCQLEKITTLGEFADFAQSMPPHVIVGGDFRTLLNALAHVNEEALAAILPFRPGSKGLHLPEALGLLVAAMPVGERLALFKRFGGRLTAEEQAKMARLDKNELRQVEAGLRERAARIFGVFQSEFDELTASLKEGGSLDRYLVVLEDPVQEALAMELLEPALRTAGAPLSADEAGKRGGLRGLLTRWFKKR
ncbi:MAG TPA: hypothetical protein VLT83_12565 [Opitutaceae bacterium]|nr:hypothetical protein [Opitutaceae bacterium]